jgi:inorganic pyrophosphatase
VAVVPKGPLGDVRDLDDLEQSYPGVAEILEIWFTGYKGPGRIESLGYEKAPAAERILRDAAEAYRAPEAGEAP